MYELCKNFNLYCTPSSISNASKVADLFIESEVTSCTDVATNPNNSIADFSGEEKIL